MQTTDKNLACNDWLFYFMDFLQKIEFSSWGSVPFAVIYPRIQAKSLAIFLHVREKRLTTGAFKIKRRNFNILLQIYVSFLTCNTAIKGTKLTLWSPFLYKSEGKQLLCSENYMKNLQFFFSKHASSLTLGDTTMCWRPKDIQRNLHAH